MLDDENEVHESLFSESTLKLGEILAEKDTALRYLALVHPSPSRLHSPE